jgi:hypothetical protein
LTIAFVDGGQATTIWVGLVGSLVFGVLAAALGMLIGHLLVAAREDA